MLLAEKIRDEMPSLRLMTNHGGGNFKKQLSRADKHGAKVALILGEDEIREGQVTVKDLRNGQQNTIAQHDITAHLTELLG